ncbi:hypothetical protein HMF8227_01175 [Saliniradius amylolyticus]|uniref:O-antigen ligase-related domain-containing protein n=1 Tax=Saliniradius amylolyticus TaxID=2183582 RepID=A0A2S2E1Y9_9ALTE|nr:O-antigen ligase family protein [Saliniradius amylolyticus]AWL11656.1 hypothetical protein HMF8227_01175 [Saliniradius amylolyticus]
MLVQSLGKPQSMEAEKSDSTIPFVFLLIYFALVLIRPHEMGQTLYETPIIRYSLILTFIAYLLLTRPKVFPIQFWLCLAVTPVMVVSGALNGWLGGGVQSGINFLTGATLPFLVVCSIATTPARQKTLMLLAILAAILMVHNGISQRADPMGIGWSGAMMTLHGRITYLGFLNDPNDLAMFLVMTLPFVMFFIYRGNWLTKILMLGVAVFLAYGVYLTNSRGAIVSLLFLMAVGFYFRYGKVKAFFFGLLLLPLVVVVLTKFRSIDASESSAYGRVDAWYEGMQMFFSNPLFGVGQNNFLDHHGLTAHNSYVLVLAELGMVGYLLWMLFALLTLYMVYPRRQLNTLSLPEKKADVGFEANGQDTDYERVREQQLLMTTYFYSFLGFLSTAFFLSRSYTLIGYLFAGLAVASFYRTARMNGSLNVEGLGRVIWLGLALSAGAIASMVVIIKLLI